MTTHVRAISMADEQEIRSFLMQEPYLNMILIAMMQEHAIRDHLYVGCWIDNKISAVAFVWEENYLMPWSVDDRATSAIARRLGGKPFKMIVGSRDTVDKVVSRSRMSARWCFNHVMMMLERVREGALQPCEVASIADIHEVIQNSIAMSEEDIQKMAAEHDEASLWRHNEEKLNSGNYFIYRNEEGKIVFQVLVSYQTPVACGIGGVYVLPEARGQGLAEKCLRWVLLNLLATFPRVILEVREENTAAIKTYERLGFHYYAPFRMYRA
ncbi:MAG: GNAT family N-acetyltransferase [Actinobacteria bacterium]|nr:GNAT family N-acetyltransferase [Actinomycetota bacterium]